MFCFCLFIILSIAIACPSLSRRHIITRIYHIHGKFIISLPVSLPVTNSLPTILRNCPELLQTIAFSPDLWMQALKFACQFEAALRSVRDHSIHLTVGDSREFLTDSDMWKCNNVHVILKRPTIPLFCCHSLLWFFPCGQRTMD